MSIFNKSLVKNILLNTAIRFSLVVAVATGFGFWHMLDVTEKQVMATLEKFVSERSQRERQVFTMAHQNHSILKAQIEKALHEKPNFSLKINFDEKVELLSDRTWRSKKDKYDGTQEACVFVGPQALVNDVKKWQISTFTSLVNRFGPAWHLQFQDLYFTTPDNAMVLYWPEVPSWCHDAKTELYMPDEEYLWVADLKHNPERKTVWTGLFFDKVAKIWMTSAETPVDIDGVHVATIGHDVTLNQLITRTIDDHLMGAYNFIFRKDGRLIVHPDYIEQIKSKDGYFDIQESGSPFLKTVFSAIKAAPEKRGVIRLQREKLYLGFAYIEEPGWYFVTVLPYKVGRIAANSTVWILILIGLGTLLADMSFLTWILYKHITQPLKKMIKETDNLARGNYAVHFEVFRQDEIGQLAAAFNEMAGKLRDAHSDLEEKIEKRTSEVSVALQNLKNVHEQLKQMQNQLLQSEKMSAVGQLAAGVAHEINNPLGVILGFSQSAVKRIKPGDPLEMPLKSIEREAVRCRNLVQDLLTFSRIEKTEREPVDLKEAIEGALSLVLAQSKVSHIQLVRECSDVKKIMGSKNQIQQVIVNLSNNAMDAMPEGGVLTVRLFSAKYEKQEGVEIQIQDTGKGIPAEIRSQIFNPFFTTKEIGKGTGLGLSLVFEIVQKHGGRIHLESEIGKGTIFKVFLPSTEKGLPHS